MKRTPLEDLAILYFKGVSSIREKIYKALRKKYKLSDKQLELNVKEIYSEILERFVKDETKRLKGNKAKLIEFDLSETKINHYIKSQVDLIKLNPIVGEQKNITKYQFVKERYDSLTLEDSNLDRIQRLQSIADEMGLDFSNVESFYYYALQRDKKLRKKLRNSK